MTAAPFGRDRLVASRRASRTASQAWREGAAYRDMVERFDRVPPDDEVAAALAAAALLADAGWVGALLDPLIAALAADPAFEPPLRVVRDARRIGAILFDHPRVAISAAVLAAAPDAPPPASVVMPGRLTLVRYHRAGGASWRGWAAEPVTAGFTAAAAPRCRPLPDRHLSDGDVVRHDGRIAGGFLAGATSDVVTVTALIRAGAAPLMREYAAATGNLVRVAAQGETDARAQMLLTLLRVAGRADAGATFEAATRADAFHLRWSAMREWLALDVAAALPRLAAMAADDPHPEVRAAASATLAVAHERQAA